jgi:hypothetical protein
MRKVFLADFGINISCMITPAHTEKQPEEFHLAAAGDQKTPLAGWLTAPLHQGFEGRPYSYLRRLRHPKL